jgi:hypothetical protein
VKVVRFPHTYHLFITGSGRSNPLDDLKPAHANVRVSTTIVPPDHVDNAALASCAGLALLARHAEGTLRERQPGHARPPTVTRVRPILLLARLSCPRLPGLARTSASLLDGKEGVDVRVRQRALEEAPHVGAFSFRSTCSQVNVRWFEKRPHGAAPSMAAMDITIHASFPPARRPGRLSGLLSRHSRLRGPQRRRVWRDALDHGWPRGPAGHVDRPVPAGRHPGITDDQRRTVAEMMAKGTYASINLAITDLDGTFERLQAGDAESFRSRPSSLTGSATAPFAIPRTI